MNTVLHTLANLVTVVAQIVPEYQPSMLPLAEKEQNNLPFIVIGALCLTLAAIGLVKMRRRRHRTGR